ncbi:MAG: MarR family transcriptional regulator [Actinomycetes bacterium]
MPTRSATGAPPLDPAEELLWRSLTNILIVMRRRVMGDLERRTGIPGTEYLVLRNLFDAPGRRMRMQALARACDLSASRISRVVDTLVAGGHCAKCPADDDGRGAVASITASGVRRLRIAYPAVLESVRANVFDHLAPDEVSDLGPVLQRIAAHLGPKSS